MMWIIRESDNDYVEYDADGEETGRSWSNKPSREDIGSDYHYRDVVSHGDGEYPDNIDNS